MLYEVALTPGVFDKFPAAVDGLTNQALVQVLHDVRRTGFLANLYNGNWWPDVNRRCKGLAPAVRGMVTDLLDQLHDRGQIVQRPKQLPACPKSDPEWLEESLASHSRAPLYAILTRNTSRAGWAGAPPCVVPLEEALINSYWRARRFSRRVPRTKDHFAEALTPLLSTARSIRLIDAQIGFRTHRGNREFLRALSVIDSCAAPPDRRAPLSLCEIHTLDDGQIPDNDYPRVAQVMGHAMPRIRAVCKTRSLYIWKERQHGKRFHNRRILTNQAAVLVGWGLDLHDISADEPGDDEWALLDDEVALEILKDFQPNSSPYDLKLPPLTW